jgi:uncharacterized membrane protein
VKVKAKGKAGAPAAEPAAVNRQMPLIMAGLAALGLAVSTYLTVVHLADVPLVCLEGSTGCAEVNRSIYSEVAGVPVALLGAGSYLVILAVLWAESQKILKAEEATLVYFGVSLAGVLYSAYLTYVELAILHAVCSWCVISAIAITVIFGLSVVRLRAMLEAVTRPARGKAK